MLAEVCIDCVELAKRGDSGVSMMLPSRMNMDLGVSRFWVPVPFLLGLYEAMLKEHFSECLGRVACIIIINFAFTLEMNLMV